MKSAGTHNVCQTRKCTRYYIQTLALNGEKLIALKLAHFICYKLELGALQPSQKFPFVIMTNSL